MNPTIFRKNAQRIPTWASAMRLVLLVSLLVSARGARAEQTTPSPPASIPPSAPAPAVVSAPRGAPASALGTPSAPSPVGTVDFRYPFTLEAAGTAGFFGTFGTYSTSLFIAGGSLSFAGPVSEGRQVIGGVAGATGSTGPTYAWLVEAFGGYRILTFADPWRTRFDAELAVDYARYDTIGIVKAGITPHAGVGLGVRGAVCVQYFFSPSFGIGPQIDVQLLAITFSVVASFGAVVTFDW